MERENEKVTAKKKRAETQRIYDLAQRAYAKDPRMNRILKAQEDAKRAVKEAKVNAKKAAEEEARRAEAEKVAAAAAAEEARKADNAAKKAAKEKEKKALKRLRAEFMKLGDAGVTVTDADLDLIFTSTSQTCVSIAGLLDDIQRLAPETRLHVAIDCEREERDKAKAAMAKASVTAPAPVKAVREWSVHEASMLAKGIARYPPGTKNRWVMIAEYVNSFGGGNNRTPDDCILKSRSMGEEEKKKANQSAYAMFVAARGAEPEIKDADAAPVKPIVVVTAAPVPAASVVLPVVPAPSIPTVVVAPADPVVLKPATSEVTNAAAHSNVTSKSTPGEDHTESNHSIETEPVEWTAAQQSALERALRDFPASMDKTERWRSIAAAVPGRSRKECIERFKEIREKVLASKAS
jgi:DnaJ family protein C protein 2